MSNLTTLPNPTTTSAEDMGDGAVLAEAHWVHGPYTLIRRQTVSQGRQLSTPRWSVSSADRDLPSLDNNAPYRAETPEFGVNWSAMGTRSADDALAYANQISVAAAAANYFNEVARLATELTKGA